MLPPAHALTSKACVGALEWTLLNPRCPQKERTPTHAGGEGYALATPQERLELGVAEFFWCLPTFFLVKISGHLTPFFSLNF